MKLYSSATQANRRGLASDLLVVLNIIYTCKTLARTAVIFTKTERKLYLLEHVRKEYESTTKYKLKYEYFY